MRPTERVVLSAPGWGPVTAHLPTTAAARFRGLRPYPAGRSLLLRAQMVTGAGMATPLRIVDLDGEGEVISVRLLRPRGLRLGRGAWTLEMPIDVDPPAPGVRLGVRRARSAR